VAEVLFSHSINLITIELLKHNLIKILIKTWDQLQSKFFNEMEGLLTQDRIFFTFNKIFFAVFLKEKSNLPRKIVATLMVTLGAILLS